MENIPVTCFTMGGTQRKKDKSRQKITKFKFSDYRNNEDDMSPLLNIEYVIFNYAGNI